MGVGWVGGDGYGRGALILLELSSGFSDYTALAYSSDPVPLSTQRKRRREKIFQRRTLSSHYRNHRTRQFVRNDAHCVGGYGKSRCQRRRWLSSLSSLVPIIYPVMLLVMASIMLFGNWAYQRDEDTRKMQLTARALWNKSPAADILAALLHPVKISTLASWSLANARIII